MKYPVTAPDRSHAAMLFDQVVLGLRDEPAFANQYQIVALPGQFPATPLLAGDLVISRALGEGGIASAARVTADREYEPENRAGWVAGGRFFECERENDESALLRVFDESGRLPLDRLVLRPRAIEGFDDTLSDVDGIASLGEVIPVPLDASVMWSNGKAYFFKGDEYVRYDVASDKADAGYPKKIDPAWPGLKWRDIDAAMNATNGKAYFFKGDQYLRYDIKGDKADAGYPKKIAGNWPGLTWRDIDACVQLSNGKVYFFKGDSYVRYDMSARKVDAGYPKKIVTGFPGVPWKDLDTVIMWTNGKAYFFKGNEYIRYDVKALRADAGYPKRIGEYWPGLVTCACTPGRKYAYARLTVADVIGVCGNIETRYGHVCCEGKSTLSAYHVAYANVSKEGGAKLLWAQSGWGRERNPGSNTVSKYRYAEMNGKDYKVEYDTAHAPAEGSTHMYRCDLNASTGKWTFRFDGTAWKTFTDTDWKTKGNSVQWTGEIRNAEDDMPGTDADRCEFSKCQYRKSGGNYQDAGLTDAHVRSDDASEWGAKRLSGTSFEIWDKKPI